MCTFTKNYTIMEEYNIRFPHGSDRGKDKRKMRRTGKGIWSQETAVALGLAMLLGITGCAEKEADPAALENTEGLQADGSQEGGEDADGAGADADKADSAEDSQDGGGDADAGADADKADGAKDTQEGGDSADASGTQPDTADGVQTIKASEGTQHLGGKIWKLQEDGMTFAHTSLVDEDMGVTLLDVEDAEKIQVKFTEDTKVEHWIIQGGGAGIDMQDAAFSDLKEGMGVELEGYYDGDTFVATKVIIEDYE